ncbi:PTS sugar transporter subunit IIB [Infirmifilum sp. NZ]|uniref:PTS sugar transporter subunit IIB n=1 Tax=Infirmifilum sp. NZ TaxID=2926850 RepID=UPI00279D62D1|nr:PTS sugar transporter subunit IIB [Infirmifilum sp. NZ]UNQ73259.1 PTS sugar transporter subunit IIB [Infirmifilum sp. NZ]
MPNRLKIVTACGLGTGTALFLKTVVESIVRKAGIDASVETADATLAAAMKPDIIVTGPDLAERFQKEGAAKIIIAVYNYGNRREIEEKLLEAIQRLKG